MVLRKPYKFFIKHFRLIHLILALLSSYLLVRTSGLINFLYDYVSNSNTIVGTGTSTEYFSGLMILSSILVLLGSIIILIVMKMKKKPVLFYIINIIAYSIIAIIYIYDNNIIKSLEVKALDIRTVKLASDFTTICFLVQTFSTITLYIRAVGFNLKKFNFDEDLRLEIDESDDEEFEFDVTIDSNKIKRKLNKSIRDFKVSYEEHKFIYRLFGLIIVAVIGIGLFLNFEVYNKVYRQGKNINTSEYSMSITDSYLTNSNYKNNKITDNYLVAVKLKIRKFSNDKKTLETARFLLNIGKVVYKPTKDYKNDVVDLGNTYNGNNISDEFTEYLLVFEIPKNYSSKKMILSYSDPYMKKIKVRIRPKKFDGKGKTGKGTLNNELLIDNNLVKNTKFKITDYLLNNKIKATYDFCETKNVCYKSYEYVVPLLNDNYVNTVLRLKGTSDNYDFADIIERFASIKYTISGEEKVMDTKIKEIKTSKSKEEGTYYFQVYEDVKKADSITLVLTVRNNVYEYKIK